MAEPQACGFAVVYRWRLKEGTEERFRKAWSEVTTYLREHHGALGSRLHRGEFGLYLAYAQWPSMDAWERMQVTPSGVPEASQTMRDCILESFEDLPLTPLEDQLSPVTLS